MVQSVLTFHRSISLGSYGGLKSEVVEAFFQKIAFLEKTTPYWKIFKNSFQKDSSWHRSMYCVQISWNLADWKLVKSRDAYLTKKNKISARCLALASAPITPKICQGQHQTMYSDNNNNNHFTALCPGLPGWASTRRNTHPPTILSIIQSLSAPSIYHDP